MRTRESVGACARVGVCVCVCVKLLKFECVCTNVCVLFLYMYANICVSTWVCMCARALMSTTFENCVCDK